VNGKYFAMEDGDESSRVLEHHNFENKKDVIERLRQIADDIEQMDGELSMYFTCSYGTLGDPDFQAWVAAYKCPPAYLDVVIRQILRHTAHQMPNAILAVGPAALEIAAHEEEIELANHMRDHMHEFIKVDMRKQIELVSYGPYLEVFARTKAPGWDQWNG
jgi:hypothetical protein